MEIRTDSILVGIAIFLGVLAIGFFIASGLFNSPITDASLILAVGAITLLFTQYTEDSTLVKGGQIIFSISTLSATLYVVTRFSSGQIFLSAVFAVFTFIFLISAYIYNREETFITTKRVKILVIVFGVLFILTAGIDVVSGEPNTEIRLNDTATQTEDNDYKIGTLRVANPSILPQRYDYPTHRTCITGLNETEDRPNRRIEPSVYYDQPDIIYNQRTVDIRIGYSGDELENATIVEDDNCPMSTSEPTIHFLGQFEP